MQLLLLAVPVHHIHMHNNARKQHNKAYIILSLLCEELELIIQA